MSLNLSPGHTPSGRIIVWPDAYNPHIYISGRSGTGKSYLLKKLAIQAVEQGSIVLVMDYTGDFQDYSPPESLCFQRIDVSSADFNLNPLVGLPGQSPDLLAQQLLVAIHSVFRMGATATLSLRRVTTAYLTSDKNPTVEGLLTFIAQLKEPDRGVKSAKEYLELLAGMVRCGTCPLSLDLERAGLIVLDYSQIIDPSLCKLLVELILQAIWTTHTPKQPPLILILDEAQQLNWGAGSMSVRILREGRKLGIAGWFSSQWLDHKNAVPALGQAAKQIYFRPDGQYVHKLAKSICDRKSDISKCQECLQRLRRGQFLWQQEDSKVVIVDVD